MAAEAGVKKKGKKAAGGAPDATKASEGKRKRGTEPEAAPADGAAKQQPADAPSAQAEGASAGPARKKQRRHKRGTAGEQQEQLDPAEALRRQRQRELQERATKLRSEGKEYVAPKKGSKPPKEGQQGGQHKDGERKGRHYLGDKQPGWRPFSSVEVIVLPIFWNNNKEEKSAVLAAAERARDVLASAGLSADMDASNKYTPGQKMKYWETMGVRVRVELGPRDVANGNCVVALSTKAPGEVASKSIVNMRHKMLDAVRAALQKARSAVTAGEEQQPEQQGQAGAGKAGKQQQAQPHGEEEDEEEEAADGGQGQGSEEEDEEDEQGAVAAALATAKSRQGGVLQKTASAEGRKLKKQRGSGAADADSGAGAGKAAQAQDEAADDAEGGAAGKAAPFSADALEDDFGDVVEFEAEEDKLTLSKKERLKKAVKQAKAKRKAERVAGRRGSEEPEAEAEQGVAGWEGKERGATGGKKKAKVVTF